MIFFSGDAVRQAVSPQRAYDAVRDAFVAYARGEWTMPPKVYVPAYPAGDFRAMPALGAGHALLKWVTSFPGNPARGLPTVTGLVLLSDASDGMLLAALDAAAVTALRTGAAAVLAAETLAAPNATDAAVIGAGVNGEAAAKTFVARGRRVLLHDRDAARMRAVAERIGAEPVGANDALAADLVVTVTPGREVVFGEGSVRAGQHVSLMGADGPGKQEIAVEELARVRVFCDDWEQASHNGDLVHGVVGRDLTLDEAYDAARLTALSVLASLRQELGDLDRVTRWLRAVGYIQTAPDFHDNAKVLNGFSDLIVELWGDSGRHARSAPGQGPSPLNVPVIVDAVVAVSD